MIVTASVVVKYPENALDESIFLEYFLPDTN